MKNCAKRVFSLMLIFFLIIGVAPLSLFLNEVKADVGKPDFETVRLNQNIYSFGNHINMMVIEGDVWMWGMNDRFSMGIKNYVDPISRKVIPVGYETVVPYPVILNENYFGGQDVKYIQNYDGVTLAVTESGDLYAWGTGGLNQFSTEVSQKTTPVKVSQFSNVSFIDMSSYSAVIKDANGWHVWGSNELLKTIDSTVTTNGPIHIDGKFSAKLGKNPNTSLNREIIDMRVANNNLILITDDNEVFTCGNNEHGILGAGIDPTKVPVPPDNTSPYQITNKYPFVDKRAKGVVVVAGDYNFGFIDTNGSAWVWGRNDNFAIGNGNGFGSEQNKTDRLVPSEILVGNASRKVISMSINHYNTILINSDNSIYGAGLNDQFQLPGATNSGSSKYVDAAKPIYTDIPSFEIPIISGGTENSTSILTRSGNIYFGGSHKWGLAGIGEYADGVNTGGFSERMKRYSVPPIVPKRPDPQFKISTEIEEDGQTYPATDKNINLIAGGITKVNVYFENFSKINAFGFTLRFDPKLVKVVSADGMPYTDKAPFVTLPTFSEESGLISYVNNYIWTDGQMIANDKTPKISNKYGYVSVMGMSRNFDATIEGKRKMFTIYFKGKSAGTWNLQFATKDNIFDDMIVAPDEYGYDSQLPNGANFVIYEEGGSLTEADDDILPFRSVDFPTIKYSTLDIDNFSMSVNRNDNVPMDVVVENNTNNYLVDYKNKDIYYTVKIKPEPYNATYKDVTWKPYIKKVVDKDGNVLESDANGNVINMAKYIEIVKKTDDALTFKISSSFANTENHIYFLVLAENNYLGSLRKVLWFKISDVLPPDSINIEKAAFTGSNDVHEGSFSNINESFTFYADVLPSTTPFKALTWKLENAYGKELPFDSLTNNVKAELVKDPNNPTRYGFKITAKSSTKLGEYVRIKAYSSYKPAVFDYVDIQIKLKVKDIKPNPSVIYMAPNSRRKISYTLEPIDAKDPNISFSLEKPGGPDSTTPHRVQFDEATRTITSFDQSEATVDINNCDTLIITATNTWNGVPVVKRIPIYVMEINTPSSDFEIVNNKGGSSDYLYLKKPSELDLGSPSKIEIYLDMANFTDPNDDEGLINRPHYVIENVTFDKLRPDYPFVIGNGGVNMLGGIAGVRIINENWPCTTPVPVDYTAERIKFVGYVKLDGKTEKAPQQKNIAINIKSVSGSFTMDTIYTLDEDGKFEINEYLFPDEYTMVISQNLYVPRTVQFRIDENFDYSKYNIYEISTKENPIYLYPGNIVGRNVIFGQEVTTYINDWFGVADPNVPLFDDFDFVTTTDPTHRAITMHDLEILNKRFGFKATDYANWDFHQSQYQ